MSESVFRIVTCKPAETLERANRLRELIGSPEAVVAPSFRKTIRVGPLRRKRTKVSAVLGGMIFVAESAVGAAQGPGGICKCRSSAAATGGVVQMLAPWKDPVTGDRPYATVSEGELIPLVEYAEMKDALFVGGQARAEVKRAAKVAGRTGQEATPPLPAEGAVYAEMVGRRVSLLGGLFTGMGGIVTAVSDGEATIDLDSGGWASTITVPAALVRVAS